MANISVDSEAVERITEDLKTVRENCTKGKSTFFSNMTSAAVINRYMYSIGETYVDIARNIDSVSNYIKNYVKDANKIEDIMKSRFRLKDSKISDEDLLALRINQR